MRESQEEFWRRARRNAGLEPATEETKRLKEVAKDAEVELRGPFAAKYGKALRQKDDPGHEEAVRVFHGLSGLAHSADEIVEEEKRRAEVKRLHHTWEMQHPGEPIPKI